MSKHTSFLFVALILFIGSQQVFGQTDLMKEDLILGNWYVKNAKSGEGRKFYRPGTKLELTKLAMDCQVSRYDLPFYEITFLKNGKYKSKRAYRCGVGVRKSDLYPSGKWKCRMNNQLMLGERQYEIVQISESHLVLKIL